MIQKLLILSLITTFATAQSIIICNLAIIDNICTCNFIIYNPDGLHNLTIIGNAIPNCDLQDVHQAFGSGSSTNIPTAICNQLPNIEKLSIVNVGIKNLNGMPFRNCRHLRTLMLGNNSIESVPPNVFSTTVLERIELNDNNLGTFKEHSFDNLENLKTLNINGNSNGLTLPENISDHIPKLQNLLASGCGLIELKTQWFANLKELVVLDLSKNNFTTISVGTFSSQLNLRFLDLSRGLLETIPETTFQNTTNLLILDLQSNKITALHENLFVNLQLLQNLYLSNNPNVTIPSNIFRSQNILRNLELASNNIAAIDGLFSSLSSLVTINLSNNNITEIPENAFTAAGAIKTINLSKNQISQLNSSSFGSLYALNHFDVHNNPIIEVDYYFMSQSLMLSFADFSGSVCTQIRTDNFGENRDLYINAMIPCFDAFDSYPIELTTFNSSIYNWYSIRTADGWDSLKVSVKAYENVHIALSDSSGSSNPPIEIQIGQNRNRYSYILDENEVKFTDIGRRLNETLAKNFIIGWRFGIVMVFREGDQFPFMVYNMENRFSVNFFGLRSMIKDGDFEAEWKVSRVKGSSVRALRNIYGDIETKLKRKIPIDLKDYIG